LNADNKEMEDPGPLAAAWQESLDIREPMEEGGDPTNL